MVSLARDALRSILELSDARCDLRAQVRGQVAHQHAVFAGLALQRCKDSLALRLDELELTAPFALDLGERFGCSVENAVN
jgi:hypothetical protein